jgi:hypothetical protein
VPVVVEKGVVPVPHEEFKKRANQYDVEAVYEP